MNAMITKWYMVLVLAVFPILLEAMPKDGSEGKNTLTANWNLGPFLRPEGVNPVLEPCAETSFYCPMRTEPVKWEEGDVFNPAAVVKDGKIVVLYRAEDKSGTGIGKRTSRIGYAESQDGFHFVRQQAPVLYPAEDDYKDLDWPGGCEDPRVAMTEDGLYVMLYTSWNRRTPRLSVATSRDLKHWTKHGLAFAKAYDGRFAKMASKSASILTKVKDGRLVIDKVDGKWPEIFGDVVEITESNYFFKLSAYQPWLIDYIRSHEDFIFPRFRAKQVIEFLKEPLNDLCISRPKERLSWGIELPFDTDYVTYVWFDALVNYISAVGYGTDTFADYWPADFHVIGKDILVPPHSVYWPIMLHALDIELPKSLLVHGWWMSAGEKMSKSLGNIVNPLDLVEKFGADAFRYFLMREMNVGQDSDFSIDLFVTRYTSDLGNDLGNLVSRLLNMQKRYCGGVVVPAKVEEDFEKSLKDQAAETSSSALELFDGMQFHLGLDSTSDFDD